jgi:hypothetical protein
MPPKTIRRMPASVAIGGASARGARMFSLADQHTTAGILAAAGFTDVAFTDVREPVYYGAGCASRSPGTRPATAYCSGRAPGSSPCERRGRAPDIEDLGRIGQEHGNLGTPPDADASALAACSATMRDRERPSRRNSARQIELLRRGSSQGSRPPASHPGIARSHTRPRRLTLPAAAEDVHPQCGRELCALECVSMCGTQEPSR